MTSQALAEGGRPRAVVCLNDRIAFGVYQALAEAGLEVPRRRVGGVLRRLRAGQLAAALPVEHRVAAVRDGSPRRGGAARHGGASRRAPRAHAGAGPRLDRTTGGVTPGPHVRLPCRGVLRVYLERGPTPTGGPCAHRHPPRVPPGRDARRCHRRRPPASSQALGYDVVVERGAGTGGRPARRGVRRPPGSGSTDAEEVWTSDIVVKVNAPTPDEIWRLRAGATVISLMAPARSPKLVEQLQAQRVTALAMDAVPRISRAQAMDVLSSMANVAGYRAVDRGRPRVRPPVHRPGHRGRQGPAGAGLRGRRRCRRSGRHRRRRVDGRDRAGLRRAPRGRRAGRVDGRASSSRSRWSRRSPPTATPRR